MTGAPISPEEADALLAPLRRYPGLVLAVSGGADSTALLHLVAAWARRDATSRTLVVATVDHALRANSAAEAAAVARQAETLGLVHRTLLWAGPKPSAGIQAAARDARYRLLVTLAAEVAGQDTATPVAIVTAHTADDQAETLLMRLARGSGVDGLAAIPPLGRLHGFDVVRPLLGISRDRLVATLAAEGIGYIDDPSNTDTRFERVRMRDALARLRELGFTADSLARTATRMQAAKVALESAVDGLQSHAVRRLYDVFDEIDWHAAAEAPHEIGTRLLRRSLLQNGGDSPPAELAQIEEAYRRVFRSDAPATGAFTLGGCIVEIVARETASPRVRVYREPDRAGGPATVSLESGQQMLWDRRFEVALAREHPGAVEVITLGGNWVQLVAAHPGLAALGLPAAVARGLPAFCRQGHVLAVPTLAACARQAGDRAAADALAGPLRSDTEPMCTARAATREDRININPDLPADPADKG